ncbi:TTT co-chaperone complex, armadillo-type fold subunit Tti1 [Schizosaccharomyces pombe]|uniref:TEL2-interacting protein 1 n=1 Tax=Schizosaccharomyces pombe (strain 972 / ATCC 24843) TaxID=284812 RepID=TTI1_SCHPO|nr:Tel Two Interacting protein 1 [Schizosaccharomyces pombe]O94600.1 RecName: Full=TEL2-interacting protein 1 [Schizosaccharomyces pombe 972h-]CAA21869.1 Tel Two Interacting protein 1 [Schizosaccharomyces pombe]|eukprot:NP_588185.1 Tel Two Interacting protein 1 [Schizosaccharomyces pombe]
MSHIQSIFAQIRDPFRKLSFYSLPLSSETSSVDSNGLKNSLKDAYFGLEKALTNTDADLPLNLCDYIFFPIVPVLKSWYRVPSTGVEYAIQCVNLLYKHGWREAHNEMLTMQLLLMLLNIADGWKSPSETVEQDFRVREITFETLENVITDFKPNFHDKRQYLLFARALSSALDIIPNKNSSRRLQFASLCCVQKLICPKQYRLPTEFLTTFLPGIVSGLTKGLAPNGTCQYFKNVCISLNILGDTVVKAISDDNTKDLPDEKDASSNSHFFGPTKRTKSWKRATCQQLSNAVKAILHLRSSQNLHVQDALFDFCFILFRDCLDSLKDCRIHLLESMLKLINKKENPKLRDYGMNKLVSLIESFNNITMESVLTECLNDWSTTWSSVSTFASEDNKLEELNRLKSLLSISSHLPKTLQLMEPLLDGILSQLVPKSSGIDSNSQKLLTSSTSNEYIHGEFFGGNEMERTTQEIVTSFAKAPNVKYVMQSLLSKATSATNENSVRAFWAFMVLLKSDVETVDSLEMYIDSLEQYSFEVLQQLSQLNVFTKASLEDKQKKEKYNLLCVRSCIAIDSISWISSLQGVKFRSKLMAYFYPLLEHLAFASPYVSSFAEACIQAIATNCNYSTPAELLRENIDYVVNSVALKLNTLDVSPQLPIVMAYVIKNDDGGCIRYIGDVVDAIFGILDAYHGYARLTEGLLGILYAIIKQESINGEEKKLIVGVEEDAMNEDKNKPCKKIREFVQLLLENPNYPLPKDDHELEDMIHDEQQETKSGHEQFREHAMKEKEKKGKENENMGETTVDHENINSNVMDEQGEKQKDDVVDMVRKITEKAQLFLSHEQITIRVEMLKLLSYGSNVLAKEPNTFYPAINTFWPLVVIQLDTDNELLVECALETIYQVCALADDFMTSRIRQDLLPRLETLCQRWHLFNVARTYSSEHRLQRAMLKVTSACVANKLSIVVYLKLMGITAPIIRAITHMSQKYAGDESLVEETWNAFSKQNPDAVYYEREVRGSQMIDTFSTELLIPGKQRVQRTYRRTHEVLEPVGAKTSETVFNDLLGQQGSGKTETQEEPLPSLDNLLHLNQPKKGAKKPLISII